MFYVLPTRKDKRNMLLREGAGMGWFTFDQALKLEDLARDAHQKLQPLRREARAGRLNRATQRARRQAAS